MYIYTEYTWRGGEGREGGGGRDVRGVSSEGAYMSNVCQQLEVVSCVKFWISKSFVYNLQLATCLPAQVQQHIHNGSNLYIHTQPCLHVCVELAETSWALYPAVETVQQLTESVKLKVLLIACWWHSKWGCPYNSLIIPSIYSISLLPGSVCPLRYVFRLGYDLVHFLLWLAVWHNEDELVVSCHPICCG